MANMNPGYTDPLAAGWTTQLAYNQDPQPYAQTGALVAPSLPASTTALTNPFLRDCEVVISGGTVTAIVIDGTTTGLTSGSVILPSGKAISVTYSVAPTWKWFGLSD